MWRLAADFIFASPKPPVPVNRAAFGVLIPTTENTEDTEKKRGKQKGELTADWTDKADQHKSLQNLCFFLFFIRVYLLHPCHLR